MYSYMIDTIPLWYRADGGAAEESATPRRPKGAVESSYVYLYVYVIRLCLVFMLFSCFLLNKEKLIHHFTKMNSVIVSFHKHVYNLFELIHTYVPSI